jgi:hypothetical protein
VHNPNEFQIFISNNDVFDAYYSYVALTSLPFPLPRSYTMRQLKSLLRAIGWRYVLGDESIGEDEWAAVRSILLALDHQDYLRALQIASSATFEGSPVASTWQAVRSILVRLCSSSAA